KEGFLAAVFISSLISFPIFGGLAVIAPELVSIVFGNKWEGATFTLQAFSCIGFLTCIGVLQASLITSQGKARWWMNYQIFQQILTFVVVVSTYRLGVDILISAIAVKTFLTWPVTINIVLRILRTSLQDYFLPFFGPALGTAVMVASVLLLKHVYTFPETYLGLSALIVLGSAAYLAIAAPLCGPRLFLLFKRRSAV
ncbi:MAG: oligosaccharide flippase family protein, partial [Bdellovibrio sp.]